MKNSKSIFVIVACLLLNVAISYASGSVAKSSPEKQMQTEIAGLFKNFYSDKVDVAKGEYKVNVSFVVDKNKEIASVSYSCENKEVENYVKNKIETSSIEVPEQLASKLYNVSILFKVNEW